MISQMKEYLDKNDINMQVVFTHEQGLEQQNKFLGQNIHFLQINWS